MIITKFDIYKFSIPYKKELVLKDVTYQQREGCIIHLVSDQGISGLGEVSPLPGFSQESLDESIAQLKHLREDLIDQEIPGDLTSLDGKLSQWLEASSLKPSVQFGVESAIINLLAQENDQNLSQWLSHLSHTDIRVHALLTGSLDSVLTEMEKKIESGVTSFKLKVGQNLDKDIKTVQNLNQELSGRGLIHVDANQQWTYDQALEFAKAVTCAGVEYIEEPFKNLDDIPRFFHETFIPVALDESLVQYDFDRLKSLEGVDFIVLKPTMIGGIEKVWQMMLKARQVAIDCIISSSFESSIGLYALSHLAGAEGRFVSSGLDTLKYFNGDSVEESLQISGGKIYLNQFYCSPKNFNLNQLTKVN